MLAVEIDFEAGDVVAWRGQLGTYVGGYGEQAFFCECLPSGEPGPLHEVREAELVLVKRKAEDALRH